MIVPWILFAMANRYQSQQLNVANFYSDFFAPAIDHFRHVVYSSSPIDIDMARSNLLELYWWLYLGVEVEYFDEAAAAAVVMKWFHDISDQDFIFRHGPMFTQSLMNLLTIAADKKNLFDPIDNHRFYSPDRLREPFQTLVNRAARLILEPSVGFLTRTVSLLDDRLWIDMKREALDPQKLLKIIGDDGYDYSTVGLNSHELVCAGFLKAINYMRSLEFFFGELHSTAEVEEEDANLLERRASQIQGWRFNFRLSEARQRFEEIGKEINKLVKRQLSPDQRTLIKDHDQVFETRIRNLMENWLRRGHPEMTSTG
jgi:hypothetical protein